jgi:hypothetical protein
MNLNTIFRGPATIDPPRLVLTTPPAVELFTHLDAVVSQALRLDSSTADAAYVDLVLSAARRHFEMVTNLSLINQTWTLNFDMIPLRQGQFGIEYGLAPTMSRYTGTAAGREIQFARAPLVSTVDNPVEFRYVDQDSGTLTLWPSTNYTVGNVGVRTAFGRLWLNADNSWPNVGDVPNALQIKFTAGFGTAQSAVPEDIRFAVLALATYWYEHRIPINDGYTPLPDHLDALITAHRLAFCA